MQQRCRGRAGEQGREGRNEGGAEQKSQGEDSPQGGAGDALEQHLMSHSGFRTK